MKLKELECEKPAQSIITAYTKLLSDNVAECDMLILSHEVLFQRPYAIKNICDLAKTYVTEIAIIGYSRKQGEFLASAYSQWHFRSLPNIKKATDTLNRLGIEPLLFSGLEQQLITFIENDFEVSDIQDWYKSYNVISELVRDEKVVLKCGVLPKKGSEKSLVQDFCEKANLTLRDEMKEGSEVIANPSFNQDIVEAVNNAVNFGLVGPPSINIIHDKAYNQAMILLSSVLETTEKRRQSFLVKL